MDVLIERNVEAKMRDGTVLRADIYRPADDGRYPVLVQRTPYNKELIATQQVSLDPLRMAGAGYVVVIQDVRSRFTSDGDAFFYYRSEFDDGHDTIEWAAALPYSDGQVGAYGTSYMGGTAWQSAVDAPSSLATFVPTTSPGNQFNVAFPGGAYSLGLFAMWALQAIGPGALVRKLAGQPSFLAEFEQLVDDIDAMSTWYRHLPLKTLPPARPDDPDFVRFFFETLDHPTPDSFWEEISTDQRCADVKVPALVIAGWHDVFLAEDLNHFAAMREHGGSPEAREQTRLLIGPWSHGMFLNTVGEVDFGLRAALIDLRSDITAVHRRWFDRWLKDERNGVDDEPPIRIFVQGINRWRYENEWPLARAVETPWYLGSDGELSPVAPTSGGQSPDVYVYDPADPSPTRGGSLVMPKTFPAGPVDQGPLLDRSDVLVYTSAPLASDLEVTGPVRTVLYAATSAPDTDWVVKLCEVGPDGRTLNVTDGILRARYRSSMTEPTLVEPDAVELYEVDMRATSIVFKAGNRLRVLVTSSDFPRYDRNLNTGELSADSATFATARQSIFHDGPRPSHIVLPVVP